MEWLNGRKTYITGFIMVAMGVAELFGIDVPGVEAANASTLVAEGFAIIFLRKGIASATA